MIITFDIETYEKKEDGYYHAVRNTNKFVIGSISWHTKNGYKKTKTFYNKDAMRQYIYDLADKLARRKKALYCYAHWGQYDYYGIFKQDVLKHDIIMEDNIYVKIKENAYIVDTKSFFPYKLEKIGKEQGLPKLEMPLKIKEIEELKEYVERDTEILLEAITGRRDDLKEIGINPKYMITAGQVSKSAYTRWLKNNKPRIFYKFFKQGILKGTKYDQFLRKAYKIGRTEAFRIGEYENCTKIDVNSLFPYAMKLMRKPDITQEYVLNYPLKHISLKNLLENYVGICKCTMKIPDGLKLGFLGIKYKGFDVYPKREGTIMTGHWAFTEITKAIKLGYTLLNMRKAVFYKEEKEDYFGPYVEWLFSLRLKYPHMDKTIKNLMTNLHGKLGVKLIGKKKVIAPRSDYDKMIAEGYRAKSIIDDQYFYEKIDDSYKPNFAHVGISALMVAKEKEMMYDDYMKVLGDKEVHEGDLLYTGTDSIIFKGNHKHKFDINKKKFGAYKLEEENETAKIRKEKMYEIGKDIKASGINKDTLKPGEIMKYDKFKKYKMITYSDAIKRGNLDLIGEFIEETYTISEAQKMNLELPDIIVED